MVSWDQLSEKLEYLEYETELFFLAFNYNHPPHKGRDPRVSDDIWEDICGYIECGAPYGEDFCVYFFNKMNVEQKQILNILVDQALKNAESDSSSEESDSAGEYDYDS